MVGTLTNWIAEQPEDVSELTASRRLHLHFLHSPVEIYDDAETPGRVAGMKFERTELDGTGNVRGTGEFVDYPVQAVYRAVGYFGSALPEVEFDHKKGVVPNDGGRVLDAAGTHVPGIYATGWIKRGPVGLIGHTKGDALETVTYLLEDRENLPVAAVPEADAVVELLDARGVKFTSWEGWLALDAHERALGEKATEAAVRTALRSPASASRWCRARTWLPSPVTAWPRRSKSRPVPPVTARELAAMTRKPTGLRSLAAGSRLVGPGHPSGLAARGPAYIRPNRPGSARTCRS